MFAHCVVRGSLKVAGTSAGGLSSPGLIRIAPLSAQNAGSAGGLPS